MWLGDENVREKKKEEKLGEEDCGREDVLQRR